MSLYVYLRVVDFVVIMSLAPFALRMTCIAMSLAVTVLILVLPFPQVALALSKGLTLFVSYRLLAL